MQRVILLLCLLLLAVCWSTWSLRAASLGRDLGRPPRVAVRTSISELRRRPAAFAGQTVAVTGQITDRCPTAGCWFYLNDGTSSLRVDARAGAFSVLGLPIGARLTVFGTLVQEPDEEQQLSAVGARR
jgi:hypothetical protein